jgi:hypothetical protein
MITITGNLTYRLWLRFLLQFLITTTVAIGPNVCEEATPACP